MSYHVESCGRCGAKIVDSDHRRPNTQQFYREMGSSEFDSESIRLCSMCLDDVWESVFETQVDRSDKADPIALARVTDTVESHINDLETLRERLER